LSNALEILRLRLRSVTDCWK